MLVVSVITRIAIVALLLAVTSSIRGQVQLGGSPQLTFDVASVKQNNSGGASSSNIPLVPGAGYPETGGLFSAVNTPFIAYLAWAYNLSGDEALRSLSQLPKWADSDRFDIEARAHGNPTKPQMQLMMQSLLADRFKLHVHTETKEGPVYALVASKPNRSAPYLRPHVEDGPCSGKTGQRADPTQEFPPACSTGIVAMQPTAPGRVRIGGRNVKIEQIASALPLLVRKSDVAFDRPVLDRTNLDGAFDFAIEFMPQAGDSIPADATGPSFLEALQDQLGLKIESATGPISTLIIDHVEEPTAN